MSTELATRSTVNSGGNYSLADLKEIARAVVQSGFGDIRNEGQALTLMLLSEAEGIHPVHALRQFHIIKGRPSMKADAMQAKFEQAGGIVEILERTDTVCRCVFYRDQNDATPLTVEWTFERAKTAGLTGSEMYKKYARNMLYARTISEGVRAKRPGVVVGIYTPEEIEAFEEPKGPRQPSRGGNASKAAEVVDGEVIDSPVNNKVKSDEESDPAFFQYFDAAVESRGFDVAIGRRMLADKLAGENKKFSDLHERHRGGIISKTKRDADAEKKVDNYDGELRRAQMALIAEAKGGSPAGLLNRAEFEASRIDKTLATINRDEWQKIVATIEKGDWDAFIRVPTLVYNTQAYNQFYDLGIANGRVEGEIDAAWAAWCTSIGIKDTDDVPGEKLAAALKAIGEKTFDWATGTMPTFVAAAAAA